MKKGMLFNWEYKIIALSLAVALYVYTSDLITIEKYIIISNPSQDPDAITDIPEGFVVTGITPAIDIELRVSGPRTIIEKMKKNIPLRLKLSEDAIRDGQQIYPVTNNLLGLDPSIKIISARPRDDIVVNVSRVKLRNIILNFEIKITDYPSSLMSAEITVDKTSLEVSGAENIIDGLKELAIAPISYKSWNLPVEEVISTMKRVVPVQVIFPPGVKRMDASPVYATIIIKPQQSKMDVSLKIQIQAPLEFHERYLVKLATPVMTVNVHGPEHKLSTLNDDLGRLTAKVKLDASMFSDDQTKKVLVSVEGPSWLSASPAHVSVTAYLREDIIGGGNGGGNKNIKDDATGIEGDQKVHNGNEGEFIVNPDDGPQKILPDRKRSILPE